MIIEFFVTAIAAFGTLTIIAYLKQFEDAIAELQKSGDVLLCPACHIPHHTDKDCQTIKQRLTKLKKYYNRKRRATFGYTKRSK